MVLGWVSATGWGVRVVEVLSSAYIGFGSTFVGGVICGLWGFVDAFLAGLILAPFYNLLAVGRHSERLTIRAPSEQPAR